MTTLGHEWIQSTTSLVERGERNLTIDELLGLAIVLAATPQELLDPRGIDHRSELKIDLGIDSVAADAVRRWIAGEWRVWVGPVDGRPRLHTLPIATEGR